MGGENRADECRHGMLRLAHGQADRGLSGFDVAQELAQPHERRAADVGSGGRSGMNAFGGGHEHGQSGAKTAARGFVLP